MEAYGLIVYLNGRFLPKQAAAISPDDRGFLFADGTYEVIRIYHGRFFRFEDHLRRLRRSLREIRIDPSCVEGLEEVARRLLHENGFDSAEGVLYVQVTRGVAARHHRFPPPGTSPTVYASLSPAEPLTEKWEKGVGVILVPDIRWTRCDIKSISLLPNVLANQEAWDRGADEALFVRDGCITEGTHTNFAAFFDGTLWTHPADRYILDGITREVVLELCQILGIPVREEPIPAHRVAEAEECLLLGSTTEVMPVIQIDQIPIRGGTPGPLTRRLQKAFYEITRGDIR